MIARTVILALALAGLSLTFMDAAHASGNLAVTMQHDGQLKLDGQAIGTPIGTAVKNSDGDVLFQQVFHDATGESLCATIDALVVHNRVVKETVIVRDAHTQRLRVELHPDTGLSLGV